MADYDFEKTNEPYSNPNINEFEDYSEEDLEYVYRQGSFNNWDGIIGWLHDYGGEDNYLHKGKVKNMIDDLNRLHTNNEEFSKDPDATYKMIKG